MSAELQSTLYGRWRRVAREFAAQTALREMGSGRHWTFADLEALTGDPSGNEEAIVFPRGIRAEFIFSLLRAWRAGRIVCPLDDGQPPPGIPAAPPGCVHLKLTSASSAAPKMIAFTAEQLAADAENIVSTMGLRRDWPNIGAISLAHSYGFSNLVLPLLLHGIPLILVEAPLPEPVRQAIDKTGDVTMAGVPALWRAWHEAGAITPGVRLAISAGARLPLELERAVHEETGVKIHNFYGASECGGIAFDSTKAPRADETLAGRPLNNVNVSTNEGGCLEVRSRAVGRTYWPEPEPGLADGCFQTSDLAELDNGHIFLRGRAGDLINVAGRKVSPEQIESALLNHPAVGDCLVFGVPSPDAGRGECIVACVRTVSPTTPGDLKEHLLQCLPAWQVPRDWWFMESLPPNQRGKLSRADWRQRYLQRGDRMRTAGPR